MLRVEDGEHTISEVITSVLISCQQKDLLTYGNLDFDLGELISYSCITNFLNQGLSNYYPFRCALYNYCIRPSTISLLFRK
jgi:hypothetical protein